MKKIIEKIKNIRKNKVVKLENIDKWNFLFNTFYDLSLVYKNFLNWNKNKIFIYFSW